ncbi:hypothetical protein HF285_04660 [Acidithiobacillus ferrooxidans F221]|uniref:hypothetical protein n=1 Tax=Acidithiobacillus ferrooxidans TaxID=920 RepID=UPI001C079274|nr:hypothetical protein [Acidithiobacillus ferrooxidans]MBU2807573.1 hypothetical protein [Acidithiobacillus ferrooxidans F221]
MTTKPLERELATYEQMLPTLLADEGKYAVIHADDLIGIYESYADALKTGYERCGVDPFLVKRISQQEQIFFVSRDLVFQTACQA